LLAQKQKHCHQDKMLLSCCFREPKKKKLNKNKRWKNESRQYCEDSEILISPPLITSPLNASSKREQIPTDRKDRSSKEDTHAPSEIEQQKTQRLSIPDFTSHKNFNASTPVSKDPLLRIISPAFQNVSNIQSTKQNLAKNVRRMFASVEDLDGSNISVSNASHVHKTARRSNPSLVSTTSPSQHEDLISSTPSIKKVASSDSCNIETPSSDLLEASNLEINEEAEETSQLRNDYEEERILINNVKEEYEKKIEELKEQNLIEIENEKKMFLVRLLEQKETHRKELENVKTNAKNAANETISQLNKQIVLERAKMLSEQQNNCKRMEEEFKMKEDRLNHSLALFEESLTLLEKREQEWQDEKANILTEVQRLKADATKMVKILAMEYEEEDLSEDKKRSLSQEVYSLQLVVEMRTGEVKKLREQVAKATLELEEAKTAKDKLRNAEAKIEDLEEQIKIKKRTEKQLSVEKRNLEMDMTNTNKAMNRMSKDVETLQWRIRNNFDLPVENLSPEPDQEERKGNQRTSLPTYITTREQENSPIDFVILRAKSSPIKEKTLKTNQAKTSFLNSLTQTMTTIQSSDKGDSIDDQDDHDVTSDLSPCSDEQFSGFPSDTISKVSNLENMEGKHATGDHQNDALDSLDEGLGDVFSESEPSNSPSFPINDTKNNEEETQAIKSAIMKVNTDVISSTDAIANNDNAKSLPSPVKERIPSRFSFNM